MKVVHFITGLAIGGAESLLYTLIASSDLTKNEQYVFYYHDGPYAARIRALGVQTIHIRGLYSPYDPVGLFRLIYHIYKIRPDLIHSSLWSANVIARLVGKMLAIPVVCDLHNRVEHLGRLRTFIERLTFRVATKSIAVAPSVKESFCEQIGAARRRAHTIEVIVNSVDSARLELLAHNAPRTREQLGIDRCAFIFGAVGRLIPSKGFDFLIVAFSLFCAQIEAAHLLIVGDGPERKKLEDLASKLRMLSRITFCGQVENPASFYALFDCFILPSKSEGLSMALLEACALGIPVITTGKDRQHDVIEHGINGLVVPYLDYSALTNAMLKMYYGASMREVMHKQNKALIEKHFSARRMVEHYQELFEKVIDEKEHQGRL